jgi:hypothetical protein
MVVRKTKRAVGRFPATALVLAMGWVGLVVPTLAADQPAAGERACLVVDTDVGLDDYRAIAMLAPGRDLRAVVVTEGISGVPGGATAVSMFLGSRGDMPPVLPGLASANPPAYDWLLAPARSG